MYAGQDQGPDLAEHLARALLALINRVELVLAATARGLAWVREWLEMIFAERGGGQS